MIALTPAQKQANYRKRKVAADFAERMELSDYPSVEEFIEAKLNDESEVYFSLTHDNINAAFARDFYEELQEYYHDWLSDYLSPEELDYEDEEANYRVYNVIDLLAAWKIVTERWAEEERQRGEG